MRTAIYARQFVITAICLAFSFVLPAAYADVVSADRVNVRASDSTSSEVLCQLSKGESVVISGSKGKWYMIELPARALVYINKANVSRKDSLGVVSEDKVLVRTAATKSSSVVGRLNKGASVKILKEYLDWYEIEAPKGSYGWVYAEYVNKDGEAWVKKDISLQGKLAGLDETYRGELKKPMREIELKWILEEYRKFAVENINSPEGQQAALRAEEIKLKIAEIEHLKAKEDYDAKIKNISSPRPGEAPVASGTLSNVGRISGRLSKYKLVKDGKQLGYVSFAKEDLGRYAGLPVNIWGAKKEVKGVVLYEVDAIQVIE
ncbi:MAG: SH3 domain-containing protein [Candidatus Omnitrophota bacterium]|jgi:SH3-like domain-containing protein